MPSLAVVFSYSAFLKAFTRLHTARYGIPVLTVVLNKRSTAARDSFFIGLSNGDCECGLGDGQNASHESLELIH